ncbi:patatin-like phospholipase family protein [Falsiroseomonas oryzae]|uniref:patatin-like phospholipase family protein n=1 Tax=Falsiroseomonas oryzae TaxID=2766473 RepID=UPI0022EB5047|nr:patatin-like phospholipase family protein [Roseomonas sp. MO-31]
MRALWPSRAVASALALLAGGCANVVRLDPPPPQATERIAVLGAPNARFWFDAGSEALREEARLMAEREAATLPAGAPRPPLRFLALSGGGDHGAFGAGVMVGWTAAGDRPSFNVVTGISAGALIAPFAFLGPPHDGQLREVFTAVAPTDVLRLRRLVSAVLFDVALADASPLYALIERYADERMLAAIAEEYRKGRLLLIGTTNLDLQRPVVWNIGAIAASGHPGALRLFRRILLASASIPGAFPPVLVDVEEGGRTYQEMHVDGGAATMVFLWPPSFDLREAAPAGSRPRERIAYVIRNGRMDVETQPPGRGLFTIASRSLATLLHFAGIGDVNRIYLTAVRDGVQFRLAYIDADFHAERAEPFDTAFMRALFAHGYERARTGYPWATTPPGVGTLVPGGARGRAE